MACSKFNIIMHGENLYIGWVAVLPPVDQFDY